MNNGYLKGINNFIKHLKRIAFGYRSYEHFRNRILIFNRMLIPKGDVTIVDIQSNCMMLWMSKVPNN
ncbi:transposase [Microaceticoccus formicicus]|uniref:transposase n=1 Tax=Microaceticoccus formicicus TaxID=3118105 RepID=UPI003CD016F3